MSDNNYSKQDNKNLQIDDSLSAFDINRMNQSELIALFEELTESYNRIQRIAIQLEIREKEFHSLAENIPDAIMRFTASSELIFMNGAALKYTGLENKIVIGSRLSQLGFTREESSFWERLVNIVVTSQKPFKTQFEWKAKSGTIILDVLIIPELDANAKVTSVLCVSRDITELRKYEDKLIKAKEMAEQSDRLKSAFLANMSHEVRTPMNGIIGFASMLKNPNLTEEKKHHYIDIINTSSKQLLNVMNDIIDIAKIDTQQIKLYNTDCNINEIIKELYDTYKAVSISGEVQLKCYTGLPDEEALFNLDDAKLKQIIGNLLNNAFKFTYKGLVDFGYVYSRTNKTLQFYVKDTGIGINEESKKVIFHRFRQLDSTYSRKFGGTGLGLAIAKAYTELMGGEITLDSQVDKGSTFFIAVPGKQIIEFSEKKINPNNMAWSNKTFLIAEDEDLNFIFLRELIEDFGAKVIRAMDGFEAVEQVRSNPLINLVFMDIKMPIMDGLKATEEIKKSHPLLPVIAQTAYAFSDDRARAKVAGCDDYLEKPIDAEALKVIVNKFLRI